MYTNTNRKRSIKDINNADEVSFKVPKLEQNEKREEEEHGTCVFEYLLNNVLDEWLPSHQDPFHAWISCIFSQLVRFEHARKAMRSYVYDLWPEPIFTPDRILQLTEDTWKYLSSKGLRPIQRELITQLARVRKSDDQLLSPIWTRYVSIKEFKQLFPQLTGVGPWTVKAVAIYSGFPLPHGEFLLEDKYIQQHLQYLTSVSPPFNKIRIKSRNNNKLCMILWRLKKTSRAKVLTRMTKLDKDDFHPFYTPTIYSS